jgi:hypothetical protein
MRVTRFTFAALALAALLGGAANAQHLISSKAGFVNRAEGKVHILRSDADETERGRASLGTQMRDGDRLMTEAGSRAEILLNPGSYLRLDENTVVRAVNTGLTQIRFEIVKGSAIVEIGQVEKKTPIEIVAPGGTLTFAKDGLHRIDARRTPTIVMVRQGELQVGTREQFLAKQTFKIGRGKTAQLTSAPKPELAKLDKDTVDEFDRWSFDRAQTLMAANLSTLRSSRTLSGLSYGWAYNPFFNCYTYIPGRGLFFSPYGFGFFRSYNDSLYYYPYGYSNYGGYYGGGGGGLSNPPARVIAGNDRAPVQREIEGRRIDSNMGSDASNGGFDRGAGRTISAPSTSVPVTSTQSVGGISSGKGGKP